MKIDLHVVPMGAAGLKNPITPCEGFEKKHLADWKIDLLFLCFFGCRYCSSNHGYNMRTRKRRVTTHLGIDPDIAFSRTTISMFSRSTSAYMSEMSEPLTSVNDTPLSRASRTSSRPAGIRKLPPL